MLLLKHGGIPRYDPKRSNKLAQYTGIFNPLTLAGDFNFHFQLSVSGLLLSLVDKAPSEVAVLSMKKIEAMGAWNKLRSRDASLNLSIGWIQFDNHCPNAPFAVALCPSIRNQDDDDDTENHMDQSVITLAAIIAPKHKSNIMVSKIVNGNSITTYYFLSLSRLRYHDHNSASKQLRFPRVTFASELTSPLFYVFSIFSFPYLSTTIDVELKKMMHCYLSIQISILASKVHFSGIYLHLKKYTDCAHHLRVQRRESGSFTSNR